LNSNWNLIARTIVPFIGIPTAPTERVQGIGDIQMQLFFTPAESGELIWGAGPVVSLPVATNELARTGDWGLGPTVVALKMAGPWVFGAVANQIFTVAGDDDGTEINQFLIQPFLNYNLQRGWAISTGPVITANWEADDDNVWTVPLGLGFSKVHMIGKTPVNLVFQYYRNVVRPETTGDNTVRLAAVLMFPNR
jgi:hypothetical protein